MASLNRVSLIGNLGRDPELRTFDNGGKIATVSIAVTEKWKDKQSGDQREHTEWVNLVFSDRLAEIASNYLTKGSPIYVEGKLRTRKWQDKESGQDRYSTEIRVDQMQMLGSRQEADSGERQPSRAARQAQRSAPAGGGFDDMDSDAPF